jgi:hypothetical protein
LLGVNARTASPKKAEQGEPDANIHGSWNHALWNPRGAQVRESADTDSSKPRAAQRGLPLGAAAPARSIDLGVEVMSLLIGVPRESFAGERRVATVPEVVQRLAKLGFEVAVESGAGEAANFADDDYRAAGAEVLPKRDRFVGAG